MSRTIFAYCDAGGVIQFGEAVPEGSLPIVKGEEKDVRELMGVVARHARPRKPGPDQVLLVPGIPEAENQEKAMDALIAFKAWLRKRKDPKFDFGNGGE
jgi:hypothetical protein